MQSILNSIDLLMFFYGMRLAKVTVMKEERKTITNL
jgi:hypothetical protein